MTSRLQLFVLIGLIGVALAVWFGGLRRRAPQARPAAAAAAVPPIAPVSPAPAQAAVEAPAPMLSLRERQRAQAARWSWSRDPFARGPAVVGVAGLALTGIIWDQAAPMAIINGEVMQLGQEIDGYRLLEIKPDRVWLSDGDNLFQLLLSP